MWAGWSDNHNDSYQVLLTLCVDSSNLDFYALSAILSIIFINVANCVYIYIYFNYTVCYEKEREREMNKSEFTWILINATVYISNSTFIHTYAFICLKYIYIMTWLLCSGPLKWTQCAMNLISSECKHSMTIILIFEATFWSLISPNQL